MTRLTNSGGCKPSSTIKFLYSYGGTIMPRKSDGLLRYVGGHTRILTVDRSVSYAELTVKFWEACGFSVDLKCKLPTEDLDLLVSVTSDEDLANIVEEYDRVSPDVKIRALLFPVKSLKTISPVPSVESLVNLSASQPPVSPVANPAVNKGTQQHPVVDFSASKHRPGPVSRFCRNSPPTMSRFHEEAKRRQNCFVPQRNFRQY